jgi:hypothetical protein
MGWGPSYSKVAGGNILSCSFVKLDTSNDGQVLQCGSGDTPFGISFPGTDSPPFVGLDTPYTAIINENVGIYGPPDVNCLLQISAAVSPGQHLKPDANGFGTPITSSSDIYGAVAAESGVANQIIRVNLVPAGTGLTV